MRYKSTLLPSTFTALFHEFLPYSTIYRLLRSCGVRRRRPPFVTAAELIAGFVFHVLAGVGTFAQHVKQLTGKTISDAALSQRRAALPLAVFEQIMGEALKPKADPAGHPEAFYKGLRLCGVDGSRFSVSNTPTVKKEMAKPKSRRGRAAFAQVGAAVLVELGLRNPLAAALGMENESEMVLAKKVLASLPEKSLLISDRYYGVAEVLVELPDQGQREFLIRARSNLKPRYLEIYADGSALVELRAHGKRDWCARSSAECNEGGGG